MRMVARPLFRKMMLAISVCLLAALALAMAGPAAAQEGGDGDPEHGAELFAENCATCHGAHGEGRIGAELNDVFVSMNPEADLNNTISRGRSGTFMPPWLEDYGGPLSEADIQDIIAYIESWGTTYEPSEPLPPRPQQEIPPAPEINGDPNAGYTVFAQNCVACHGETGEGRIGRNLHAAFDSIQPGAYALNVIRNGVQGSLMPAWLQANGGPLTDQQVNDVAAYVLSLQQTGNLPPAGEQAAPLGSSLPLLLVGVLTVLVILALGLTAARGSRGGASNH